MDNFFKKVYLMQVKEECDFCFVALKNINQILNKEKEGNLFQEALTLVHHAAAVSRIFWPPGCKDKAKKARSHRRGQALRDELGLTEGHPIQKRTLRDHFEHFDERLDDWVENSRNKNMIGKLIGPRNAIVGNGVEDTDIIHHYDPSTNVYAFRGEQFNIQELATGLDDIYSKTNLFLERR